MTDVAAALLVLLATILVLGLGFALMAWITDLIAGSYTTTRARRRAERRKGYVLR
jgi:hypothetical protein